MSEELRECPFCGNKDVILSDYRLVGNATCWKITCLHCRLTMTGNRQPLLKRWNTRPNEDALKTEAKRLKNKLELIKEHLIIHRDHSIKSYRQDGKTYQAMNEFLTRFCNGLIEIINTEKGEEDES